MKFFITIKIEAMRLSNLKNKINIKTIITTTLICSALYVAVGAILYGLGYVFFNVLFKQNHNYLASRNFYILTTILWGCLIACFAWNWISKGKLKTQKGLMDEVEFKTIGSKYFTIDDAEAPDKGWIIDSKKCGKSISYKHISNCNSLVYGITRAGKTTGFVLPTIYSNASDTSKPCFFITDKKDELFVKTYSFLKKQGYRIWKINISDGSTSNFWNPLAEIWSDYNCFRNCDVNDPVAYQALTSLNERINNLLDLLFQSTNLKDSSFWYENAKEFFAMILYLNLDKGVSLEEFTLFNLYKQFTNNSIETWTYEINQINAKGLVHEHKTIITDVAKAETTFAGIKATLMSCLKFLTDATIQKITSSTNINLKDYTSQPTALFLTLPAVSTDKTKLSSIYIQSFLKLCTELEGRENNPECRPVYFLADEIGNIPPIQGLSDLITTGLSKSIRCMLVFQSKAQLKANYPKDYQIIQDNCEVMILIKTKDTELASSLSRAFGTYENKAKSTNKDKDGKISGSSYHVTKEPILTETEILQLPRGKILVWIAGHKPIITRTIPIDRSKWYQLNIQEFNDKFIPLPEKIEYVKAAEPQLKPKEDSSENSEPSNLKELIKSRLAKTLKEQAEKTKKKTRKGKPLTQKDVAFFKAVTKNVKKRKTTKK